MNTIVYFKRKMWLDCKWWNILDLMNEIEGTTNPLLADDANKLCGSRQLDPNVWESEGFLSSSAIQQPNDTEIFGNLYSSSLEPTSPKSPLIKEYLETARISRSNRMDTLHFSPSPSGTATPEGEMKCS
jgi:hypothetical protein